MFRKAMAGAALAALALVWVVSAQNDAQAVIADSLKKMGHENLKTIVFSGEGWDGCLGQSYSANAKDWRPFLNKGYTRSVDFDKGWRMQRTRTDTKTNQGGCSAGPYADQQQNQVTLLENANFNNQVEFAMLPTGFLKMAAQKGATVRRQGNETLLTFPLQNGQTTVDVTGHINRQGYVSKVETKIYNQATFGDMVWEANFEDWKDFGGVKWPTHISQSQGGLGFFDLRINSVQPNAPVDLTPPVGKGGPGGGKGGDLAAKGAPGGARGGPGGGKGKGGAPANLAEDLGGNAWLITGGYASLVIEMSDHVIIAEGGQNDMRSATVLAEARRLVPNKPVRYVINTHHHSDHSGGLRYYMAEGITILTHNSAKGYYEKVYHGIHTMGQDALSQKNPKPPLKVETFGDRKIISDAMNTVEIHRVQGSTHAESMAVVYLPKQKVLLEADEFNVGAAPPATPPATVNPYHSNLLANIERLRLEVDRIIPVHLPGDGRKVTMAELRMMAGRPN